MTDSTVGSGESVPATPADWRAGITDPDTKGFIDLKGWDTPEKAIQSYRQLESHIGAPPDRLLKLPEKADDPAWGDIHKRLGFAPPATPEEYEITVPDGLDDKYAKAVAAEALRLGIPKNMVKGLADFNAKFTAEAIAEMDAATERGHTESLAALKAEWGGRYDETMTLAQRAEAAMKADMGVGDDDLLALMNASPRAYYKLLAGYGGTMREAPHISGDGSGSNPLRSLSPEAAQVRITQLKADPSFRQKYLDGDVQANNEMTHLLTIVTQAKSGR